jgi:hypothetical protein
MQDDKAAAEAYRMLEAFTKTGAQYFDLTFTTRQGEKAWFRKQVSLEYLRHMLPQMLSDCARLERNFIVRASGRSVTFIQLDDLNVETMRQVEPVSFLGLKTSATAHGYQAWIALPAGGDKDFGRRLRKGTHADPTASGAARLASSLNFKDKYAPDFPRVAITHCHPGLTVNPEQLEALGLVSAPEAMAPVALRVSPPRRGRRKWPSYERCVQGAPPTHGSDRPDISRADFTWAMTCIDWGWSIEATAARLLEMSAKARENGEAYALTTAQNAAAAVARRQRSRA